MESRRGVAYIVAATREVPMVALKHAPLIKTAVVVDPSIMSGEPVIRGTRIPAETILAYLRDGHSNQEIFEDYPSLPIDGIDAVADWARLIYGADWMQPRAKS